MEENNRKTVKKFSSRYQKIKMGTPVIKKKLDPFKIEDDIDLIKSLQLNVLKCYYLTDTVKSATDKIIQRKRRQVRLHASNCLLSSILWQNFKLITEVWTILHNYDKQLLAESLKSTISLLIIELNGRSQLTQFLCRFDEPDIIVNILQVLLEVLKSHKHKNYKFYSLKEILEKLNESALYKGDCSYIRLEILYDEIMKFEISSTSSRYWRMYKNLPRKPLPFLMSELSLYAEPSSSSSVTLETEQKAPFPCSCERTLVEQSLASIALVLQQQSKEDDLDIYAKNVACELRSSSTEDRIYLKRMMNEMFFQSQLGNAKRIRIVTEVE